MTVCAHCLQELREGVRFCPSCGAPGPGAETSEPSGPLGASTPSITSPPASATRTIADLTEAQVAEQMRLLAEQQGGKERRKAEHTQKLAEKRIERQQRLAERKALQAQKKEARARQLAEKKAIKAAGVAAPVQAQAAGRAQAQIPAQTLAPASTQSQNSTMIWVLVVIATILAMGVAGTASFIIVRQFFS